MSACRRVMSLAILTIMAASLAYVAKATAEARSTPILIGDSIPQGSDPSLQIQAKALTAAAGVAHMKVLRVDANLDLNKQIADVDTLVQKKVKVLAIWPMDGKAIQPALARAKQAGVYVITQQTPNGQNRFTNMQADDFASGERVARYLASKLGRGAKVAAIIGPQQVQSFRDLASGFKAGAKATGLDVVDTQTNANLTPDASATFANTWKQRYGSQLKGIFDSLDATAFGVIPTLDAGFHPLLATYGGSDQALQAVRKGQFAALAYQNTVVAGRVTAWLAQRALSSKKTPLNIPLPQPLVTKANIGQFKPSAQQIAAPMRFALSTKGGKTTLLIRK